MLGYNSWIIAVIDLASNQIIKLIDTGVEEQGFAMAMTSPDSRFIYVIFWSKGTLLAIDTSSHEVIKAVTSVGVAFRGSAAMTPDGKWAYVANTADGSVSAINLSSYEVVLSIPVGNSPFSIGITPDAKLVYIANYGDDAVSVMATSSHEVLATIDVGDQPAWISMPPDGKFVYVANFGENTISVVERIDLSGITAVEEEADLSALPQTFTLSQNYPNPFNSSTLIRFALPTSAPIDLTLYNLTGQKLATLVEGSHRSSSIFS